MCFFLFLSGGVLLEILENSNFLVESSRSCSSLSIRRRAPSNGRGGRRNSSSIPGGLGTNWETTHLIEFNINMILKRMCLFMSLYPMSWKNTDRIRKKQLRGCVLDGISVTLEQWSTIHVLASKKSDVNCQWIHRLCRQKLYKHLISEHVLRPPQITGWQILPARKLIVGRILGVRSARCCPGSGSGSSGGGSAVCVNPSFSQHKQYCILWSCRPSETSTCSNYEHVSRNYVCKLHQHKQLNSEISQKKRVPEKKHPRWKRNKISNWFSLLTWEELRILEHCNFPLVLQEHKTLPFKQLYIYIYGCFQK